MSIKAIGFDYGGVIGIHKSVMLEISDLTQIPIQELRTEYFKHNQLSNVGDLSYPELWKLILHNLNKSEFADKVAEFVLANDTPVINTDVINLIDQLRQSNYKVGLLSNNTKQNGDLIRATGLDSHFDTFLISAEIGFQKPDPKAFEVLYNDLSVQPSELVFIDDSSKSLESATDIGYVPILFSDYQKLLEDLTNLGIQLS